MRRHRQNGRSRRAGGRRDAAARSTTSRADRCRPSTLILGTNCGGSDGNSGVTANPALGVASDLLVAQGGTSILGETPEIYGAEHLLTRRAVSREVGEKLVERIKWWEWYTGMFGAEINNNPSPGNKEGGLTTIYEKSLGAIAKGGSTALVDVVGYAEPVTAKGFVVMDTPGYDPVSMTGIVAGGANVLVFTTGRGSVFGCKPAPSIKVATNTPMYRAHDRRHGHQRRRDSGRHAGRRGRPANLRGNTGRRERQENQERAERRRRRGVRPWSNRPTLDAPDRGRRRATSTRCVAYRPTASTGQPNHGHRASQRGTLGHLDFERRSRRAATLCYGYFDQPQAALGSSNVPRRAGLDETSAVASALRDQSRLIRGGQPKRDSRFARQRVCGGILDQHIQFDGSNPGGFGAANTVDLISVRLPESTECRCPPAPMHTHGGDQPANHGRTQPRHDGSAPREHRGKSLAARQTFEPAPHLHRLEHDPHAGGKQQHRQDGPGRNSCDAPRAC